MNKLYMASIGIAAFALGLFLWLFARPSQKPTQHAIARTIAGVAPNRVAPGEAQQPIPRPSRGAAHEVHDTQLQARPDLPPILEPIKIGEVAWMTRADEWKNVGRASVGAAIQSQYWAIARGDLDYLKKSMLMDESTKEALGGLLDQVSVRMREQYPTPEDLAAFFVASIPALKGITIGRVLEDRSGPEDVTVSIGTLEPGADRFRGALMKLHRSSDGEWLRVIEPREIARWREMIKWDEELSKSRIWSVSK